MRLPAKETARLPSAAVFLETAASYFEGRQTGGEDQAHWSNVYNAENCRAAAKLITGMVEAFSPFVDVRDQFPQSAKLINPKLSGLEPVTITVTKAQMLAAVAAVRAAREPRP